MKITEISRRNIIDEMSINNFSWNGRLSEIDFLRRVFPLQEMPSNDYRCENMADDIYQHRINNYDWDDDWIFNDSRLNLLKCDDKIFLNFLCELIHPIVRSDNKEIEKLLSIFNKHLEPDGYEIFELSKISGRSVYSTRLITIPVAFDNIKIINSEFVKKQIEKCHNKLKEDDFDGAITNARSLVEGILDEIYFKCTEERMQSTGDLTKDYKRIKNLLNLSEEKQSTEGIRALVRSFNTIIQGIDTLSNKMGDRHRPIVKPAKHHAKLVVDSAITISDFLISTQIYQDSKKSSFLKRLIDVLDSDKRFYSREEFDEDEEIRELFDSADAYLKKQVKNEFLRIFKIDSFRQSDIFFAVMRLFFNELNSDDITDILAESSINDQMAGFDSFEKELIDEKGDLLNEAYEKLFGKGRPNNST